MGDIVLMALIQDVFPEPFSPTSNNILVEPDLTSSAHVDSKSSRPTISFTLEDSIGRLSKGFPRNIGIESSELLSNTIIGQCKHEHIILTLANVIKVSN